MITVNGVKRTLEQPLSVTEYLEKNQYVPVQVAIELNDQILARELYGSTILKEGDVMEIVSFMGGGSGRNEEMDRTEDKLILGGHEFTSRFILGSGKFSLDLVKACIEKAAPISIASHAWDGLPIPASTMIGRSISSIRIWINSFVQIPLLEPIGDPRGITHAAPALTRSLAAFRSGYIYGITTNPSFARISVALIVS